MGTGHTTRLARITTVDHTGRRLTMAGEILSESDAWLTVWPVDADGIRKGAYNKDGVLVEPRWLIDKTTITKRVPLREDYRYGGLVEDTE